MNDSVRKNLEVFEKIFSLLNDLRNTMKIGSHFEQY